MSSGSPTDTKKSYEDMGSQPTFNSGMSSRLKLAIFVVVGLVVGFVIGILIGSFAVCDDDPDVEERKDGVFLPGAPEGLVSEGDPDISEKIINGMNPSNIEENLRFLSLKPHIAGRDRDYELVEFIQTRFRDAGLHVQTTPYNVLLSYPEDSVPNSVRILNAGGTVVYDAVNDESDISQQPGVVRPFNGFSPSRLVTGDLVYAGYGRVEDYNWLEAHGVSVAGKVVIVKYGKLFRGDKVDIAASKNATGVILYSDPADCTGYNIGDTRVYPDAWWLPPTGAQRGTVFTGDGDPLTPGYPANNLAYRFDQDKVEPPLPQIPSHPIGYGAAIHLLSRLGGIDVTNAPDFKGGLSITYRAGGLTNGMRVQLNVTTQNQMKKAENVFGIIKGAVEPDRYVMYGNHRDAWIYGAIDPSSGTAVMLEVARVMGELVKKGEWKPRRSIVFCSWGAEEFGLIGSTEWVEQYVATLRERAVAYINVDIAVSGNDTMAAGSTPLMYNVIHDAAKRVPSPNPTEVQAGRKTVYDTWLHFRPWEYPQGDSAQVPKIGQLGSGSDYAPLLQRAGITATDMTYTYDRQRYNISSYTLYHTEYETFDIVKEHYDRDFKAHAAVASVSGEVARSLADSLILPFNMTNYAAALETNRLALEHDYGVALKGNLGLETYNKLQAVIEEFADDVAKFIARRGNVDLNNPYAIRTYNDQIMLLEKAFLSPAGLPTRPHKKHLIFAENANDAYAGSSFPGLVDLLFEIEKEPSRWEQVRHHFHAILHTIQSAGATLRDVTSFMAETM